MYSKSEFYQIMMQILNYEFLCSRRYQRSFSIGMISLNSDLKNQEILEKKLNHYARNSDFIGKIDSNYIIVMGDTNADQATTALERLVEKVGTKHVLSSSSTYPIDGNEVPTLLGVARKRLEKAFLIKRVPVCS